MMKPKVLFAEKMKTLVTVAIYKQREQSQDFQCSSLFATDAAQHQPGTARQPIKEGQFL